LAVKTQLELYRIFHRVATCGSVSRAAGELFVTQPAVSQAIRNLEQSLEARLFLRLPRGMSLTVEGRRLFAYIDQAIGLIDAGERELRQLSSLETGELFIAAGDTLCRYHLLAHLERYRERWPGVRLRITNRTSDATAELLRGGRVDIGLVNMPCDHPTIEVEPIAEVTDCFVTNDRSIAAGARSWEELVGLPLLLLEEGTSTRRFLDTAFAERGLELAPGLELGSVDLLIRIARIGLGVASVVREYVADELDSGDLFEIALDPPLPTRHIGIAYRADTPLSPAAERLRAMVRDGATGAPPEDDAR
jgi:LysR family transcriptional regulator, cyn operon transcriptional activator